MVSQELQVQEGVHVPTVTISLMDDSKGSHLSVVVDLSPLQWHLSKEDSSSLSLEAFLTHFLTFLNSHIASKHENTLAVFGAFPGKRFV